VKRLLLLAGMWIALVGTTAARANDEAKSAKLPSVSSVKIGFQGAYKTGQWTNLDVTVEGGSKACLAQVTCTLPDGDGTPATYTTRSRRAIQLLPGKAATASLLVKLGRRGGDATINVIAEDKIISQSILHIGGGEWPDAVESTQPLIIHLGQGLNLELQTAANDPQALLRQPKIVRLSDAGQLPAHHSGYQSANAVVLCTSKPDLYRALSEQSSRVAALEDWVRDGGRLIISVGKGADEILAENAPLARFSPGTLQGITSLFRSNRIENYAESSDALEESAGDDLRLQIAKLGDVTGQVEVKEGEWPLVIRRPLGFGELVFVAFDLDDLPINRWKGRTRLIEKLLGYSLRPAQSAKNAAGNMVSTLAYSDVGGQLRAALDQFTDVEMVSFGTVATLIVAYLICIGPGDYFLVKKLLRRMELTWITFPLFVALFCLGTYAAAYRWKGSALRVNQVDIVDFDNETHAVRGTTWCNLFSPYAASMHVSMTPNLPNLPAEGVHSQVSWLGTPGAGFGSMYQAQAGATVFSNEYQFSPELDQIDGLPVAVWSTRGMTGRWRGEIGPLVDSELTVNASGNLKGTLEHHLGELTLGHCQLLHENWVYDLGDMPAGKKIELDYRANPQSFDVAYKHGGILNSTQGRVADARNVEDVRSILKGMMFFEKLGGESYLTLQSDLYRDLDFSHLLASGRAILIAEVDGSLTNVLRDGKPLVGEKDRRWSVVRVVLPVAAAPTTLPVTQPKKEPAP
jgi:hypothetical protein